MSEASGPEVILSKAREREKEYDWLGAVEFYKKALGAVPEIAHACSKEKDNLVTV